MTRFLGLCCALVALGGCLPSSTIAKAKTVEAAAQSEIDAVLQANVHVLCVVSVAALGRASVDTDIARGMYWMCPEVRELVNNINAVVKAPK